MLDTVTSTTQTQKTIDLGSEQEYKCMYIVYDSFLPGSEAQELNYWGDITVCEATCVLDASGRNNHITTSSTSTTEVWSLAVPVEFKQTQL